MKRYDLKIDGQLADSIENEKGYWVKYSDVKILEEAIKSIMYNNKLLRSVKRDIHYIGKKALQEINK